MKQREMDGGERVQVTCALLPLTTPIGFNSNLTEMIRPSSRHPQAMRSLHIEFAGLDRVDGSATFGFGEPVGPRRTPHLTSLCLVQCPHVPLNIRTLPRRDQSPCIHIWPD
jgi:hypothetical protein